MLLAADLHLDDKPENEYRWEIFENLDAHADGDIVILGDLCDRADRHSAELVNRVTDALDKLSRIDRFIYILCGNHDRSIRPRQFWDFLNKLPYVAFVTEPRLRQELGLLLLPYSADPIQDWRDIPWSEFRCVMMHQTVTGAVSNGHVLENRRMPEFAPSNIVYSGDIHTPQQVGQVTYVGAPYPIKFGDDYRCRMLKLNEDYQIQEEILVKTIQKRIVEVSSYEELLALKIPASSQVRVRFTMPASRVDAWPGEEALIAAWARENGVHVASVEAIIETSPDKKSTQQFAFDADPELVLQAFCKAEGVEDGIYQTGLGILRSLNGDK